MVDKVAVSQACLARLEKACLDFSDRAGTASQAVEQLSQLAETYDLPRDINEVIRLLSVAGVSLENVDAELKLFKDSATAVAKSNDQAGLWLKKREQSIKMKETALRQERMVLESKKDSVKALNMQANATIDLNVGGQYFTTSIQTLQAVPGSMLSAWFSGRHTLVRDGAGRVFIDRNPELFAIILDYLRKGGTRRTLQSHLRVNEVDSNMDNINVKLNDLQIDQDKEAEEDNRNEHINTMLMAQLQEEFDYFCLPWPMGGIQIPLEHVAPSTLLVDHDCIVLEGHTDRVLCVHIDEAKAVTGSSDGTVRVWDLNTKECIHVLTGKDNIKDVAMHKGIVAACSADGTVEAWGVESGESLCTFQTHPATDGSPCCMKLKNDVLAVAVLLEQGSHTNTPLGQPGVCYVWNMLNGTCMYRDHMANAMWSMGLRDGWVAWGRGNDVVTWNSVTQNVELLERHHSHDVMFVSETEGGWVSSAIAGEYSEYTEVVLWQGSRFCKERFLRFAIVMEASPLGELILRREEGVHGDMVVEDFDGTRAVYLRCPEPNAAYDISTSNGTLVSAHQNNMTCLWLACKENS